MSSSNCFMWEGDAFYTYAVSAIFVENTRELTFNFFQSTNQVKYAYEIADIVAKRDEAVTLWKAAMGL